MIVDDIVNGKVVPYDVTSVTLNVNEIPVPVFMSITNSINLSDDENYSYFVYRNLRAYDKWDLIDENGQRQEVDNDLGCWLNGLIKTYLMLFFNWNVTYKIHGQEIAVLVHGDNQNREFDNYNFDIEKLGLKPCYDEHGKLCSIMVEFNLCLDNTIVESMEKYQ
mgnify:CR=1 FL=1